VIFKRNRAAVDASLFVQVVALMAGALILAQATNLIVLYRDPPRPEMSPASDIAAAFMGKKIPDAQIKLTAKTVAESPVKEPVPNRSIPGRELRRGIAHHIELAGGPKIEVTEIRFEDNARRWYGERLVGNRPANFQFDREDPPAFAPFTIAIHQADGTWRVIKSSGLLLDPWQRRAVLTFAITFLVVLIVAYLFVIRLTQPFTRLAESADRLGRDPNAPPLGVSGPREARAAARAFNVMQERLRRYVDDRTAMVGAIAHDLRTPLTRLRFRIESLPDDQKAKMSTDLDQMEAMVAATLSFVRDATQAAQRTKLELSSVLESLADEMSDMGSSVTMERSDKVVVEGDPVALKRLFGNLLDNAVKYGKAARVRVFKEDDHAIVEIDDDGPGVPEAEKERVFEPFYRREPSRNRDTGGIGLGLAVVRTVARAHGGDAELINRDGGGLTARVSLPV